MLGSEVASVMAERPRRHRLLYNKGDLANVVNFKVIVIHAGFGDATLIEVTDINGEIGTISVMYINYVDYAMKTGSYYICLMHVFQPLSVIIMSL